MLLKKIKNNTLLITGGTGSFGNAVLNRFLNTDNFTEIRIFSRDEKKQDDLRKRVNNNKVKFIKINMRHKSINEWKQIEVFQVYYSHEDNWTYPSARRE